MPTFEDLPDGELEAADVVEATDLIAVSRPGVFTKFMTVESLSTVLGGGAGLVLSATVELTAAQSRNLFTTPQQLVAAPGADRIIVVLGGAICYTFGTSAASASENYYLAPEGADFTDGNQLSLFAAPLLTKLVNSVALFTPNGSSFAFAETAIANKALMIGFQTANATGGDGTLEISVLYSILEM